MIAIIGSPIVDNDHVLNISPSKKYVKILYQCVLFVKATRHAKYTRGIKLVFKQFVVKELLVCLYHVLQDAITVDLAARCEQDEFKVLLQSSEDIFQPWSETYEYLKTVLGEGNYADLFVFCEDVDLIVIIIQFLLFEVDLGKRLIEVKYDRFLVYMKMKRGIPYVKRSLQIYVFLGLGLSFTG